MQSNLRSAYSHSGLAVFAPVFGHRRSRVLRDGWERLNPQRLGIRTLEVVLCVGSGDSNTDICHRLNISMSTVKYHIGRALRTVDPNPAPAPDERPVVIAVLDDDVAMGEATCALLDSYGFQTVSFTTGEAFLAYAAKTLPSCLVTDMNMPGMNGVEVLDALRLQGLRVPTIVITGFANPLTRARALAFGAVGYLEKPVNDALLHELVWYAVTTQGA